MAQPQTPSSAPGAPLVRLPGRVSLWNEFIGFSSSLWLDAEWLLLADSHLMRDDYRRFLYRDIQALQMRRTARGSAYNLIAGLLAGVFLLSALLSNTVGSRLVCAGIAGAFLVALVINIARGPTCHCRLQTAFSRAPLPSLSRVRTAHRAFERIRERVAAAQGALIAPEEAVERMNQHLAQVAQRTVQATIPAPAPAAPPPPPAAAAVLAAPPLAPPV